MDSPESQNAELREWLKGANETARELAKGFTPLLEMALAIRSQLAELVKNVDVEALLQSFVEGQKWIDEAPQKLADALASEGLVPHPSLSLGDLRRLTIVFDESGSRAAAEYLFNLHEELIALPEFRKEARERWEKVGRWPAFSDALAAFDAKLYFASIPPALSQAEGVIAHLFGLPGMKHEKFKEMVAKVHNDDEFRLLSELVPKVLDGLLAHFTHSVPNERLNRNAVMHGGDAEYGTRANAVAAIVWADYIMYIADGYKAITTPTRSRTSLGTQRSAC